MEVGFRCTVNLRPTTHYIDIDPTGPREEHDRQLFRAVAAACRREHGPGQLWFDSDFIRDAPATAFTWIHPDRSVSLGMTAVVLCGVYHHIPANVRLTFEEYERGGAAAWAALHAAVESECRRSLGPGILRHVKDNEFRWERY